jgi:alkanesulfonate monooxygenase SsuD/methylene tetrahydromethanopterin reductase-like flavin-dependent oxidoreductase (luciferase family)
MMRFDLRAAPGKALSDQYAAALDMAAWGEDNGCVALVLSEHHAVDDGYLPSPRVMAGAMAARTQTVPIMIAAALLPFYEPVRLAEDMSVLHHVSNGRVSYVFGLGYRADEFALYGLDMRERARIADTKLEQLLDALDRVTPRAEPRPAISWGGGTPAAARRAARFGLDFLAQTDGDDLEMAYREECAKHGREPGNCMLANPDDPVTVFVHDDLDAAWDELGPYLLHDARSYSSWNVNPRVASISRGETVGALRTENGAHRIVTCADAKARGFLPLHPLCGGVPPELAWPYLERAAAAFR